MKRTKKTMLSTAAAAVAVTGILAGCGSGGSSSSGGSGSNSGPTPTVTVWTWRSQDQPLWTQVEKDLNASGTKVKIQFRAVNATSYDSVLQTAMDGGKGPDIFYGRAGEGTLQYAAANMLQPVDNIADLSTINKGALQSAQYQGKTYGVPFAIQTMEVFYNKDIFAKYNLQPPKTWADFMNICKTLKSNGETPLSTMGIQGWMQALNFDEVAATTIGDSFAQQLVDKKAKYNDAPFVQALTKYQSLAPYFEDNFQAVGSGGQEQETQFALGKSAMVMDGIFDVPTIQKDNPKINMGAFLIPPDNASDKALIDWYTDGDIVMNANISNAAEKSASEAIIKDAATAKFAQEFSDIAGEISPVAGAKIPSKYPLSIQAYQWYQQNPITPLFGIRSPMDTPPPTPVNAQAKKAANTDTGIFSAEQKVLLPMLTGKMTPQEAADSIQKAVSWYFN